MIIIKGERITNQKIFRIIEAQIIKSFPSIAEDLATLIAAKAIELSMSFTKSGKLASNIEVRKGSGFADVGKYDVYMDMSKTKVPYAAWVERGKTTPVGLPYSTKGGRDYSKSKFTGHHFLEQATLIMSQPGVIGEVATKNFIKVLKNI